MRNELQRPAWWKLNKIYLSMPKSYQVLALKVNIPEKLNFRETFIPEISRIFYLEKLSPRKVSLLKVSADIAYILYTYLIKNNFSF